MSDSKDLTSNVSNNTDQDKALRYVRAHMPGVRIAIETGKTQTKRSEYVDIALKRRNFNVWKAGAKKFSWDLFAIPEDLVDSLKGGLKRAAPNIFHRYASLIVKNNRWKYIHAMTLWSLLPEEYKSEWKAAAELGGVQKTSEPVPSHAEGPNFKGTDHFQNGACTYLTFLAAPELPASRVADTGTINQSGSYRDSFPTSQHRSCDTPNGAILPTDKLIYSGDENWRPFPDPLFDLLDFDNGFMPVRQPICPERYLQKYSPSYVPNFDFGLISDFGVDNLTLSRGSISPLTSEDLDERRPAKRRRQNPKESREFSDYIPIHNPKPWAPSNGLDNFFGPQDPPFPSITPKLQTQLPINTYPHNLSTVGRESKQEVCNLQGAGSSLLPRTPAEATKTSASLLSYASASRGIYGQEYMDEYHIGASIYWEHSTMPPSNFTYTIGAGQSDGNNALPLESDTIPDILSTLTPQPMTEYLTDSLLQTQESSTYEFPGGFGF